MKTVCGVILLIILFLICCGCSDEDSSAQNSSMAITSGESYSYSESYKDISAEFISGKYLGKARDEIVLPEETIYMESAEAFGFDNISVYEVCGTLTMSFKESKTHSCTFGSIVYKDETEFFVKLNEVNSKIAKELGVEVSEFSLINSSKEMDERKVVFSGKGFLKSEYETDLYKLTLSAVGTNGEAIITITQILK